MKIKYNFNIDPEHFNTNVRRLTNQLWKLIPMRENGESWERQLESVLIEIVGLSILFDSNANFLQLVSKLEGLKEVELSFSSYRRTVFEAINLLQGCKNE